ncbi:TetR/AcrR family transcriptional regulator [Dokdonella sp.]|uniref:TetR/AcrR family transcriptional regulator n=1 Tax=Dokdonella sp. TaxID=2291710 RepID=UPI001B1C20C8|nr:TetR/AcrR family transcriptional regulator [Dokdonella sp.]MBO9663746.1 TetR family transcriptional regulator [Dokdonella sp.]
MARSSIRSGSTKARLLEATEELFIEHGYEAMSLRQITTQAGANLAAVNYHFGSKEALIQELLSQRFDRLNEERLQLLSTCEQEYGEQTMDVSTVLSVLFAPGLRLTRSAAGGPNFLRLLGRVYSDPSPFIREYLREHYESISGRFFEAFSRALPQMPRHELGMRLQFSLKALSGMLASENTDELAAAICIGEEVKDTLMIARLIAFISPVLTTPFGQTEQASAVGRVLDLADVAAVAVDTREREEQRGRTRKTKTGSSSWTSRTGT